MNVVNPAATFASCSKTLLELLDFFFSALTSWWSLYYKNTGKENVNLSFVSYSLQRQSCELDGREDSGLHFISFN